MVQTNKNHPKPNGGFFGLGYIPFAERCPDVVSSGVVQGPAQGEIAIAHDQNFVMNILLIVYIWYAMLVYM